MRVSFRPALSGLIIGIWVCGAEAQAFKHPGVLNNSEELAFIAGRVKAGAQPWKSAFDEMRGSDYGSLNRAIHPRATVECGPSSNPDIGCSDEKDDAVAAYTQALLWRLSGDEAHARKAVSIVDGWAQVLKSHTNSNAPLQAAWAGAEFPRAAELLRGYSGWTQAHADRFANMMRTAFLPLMVNGSTANGNWELTMIDAMIQTAVAIDDRALFDNAVAMWRKRVPAYFYITGDGPLPVPPPPPSKLTTKDALIKFWFGQSTFVDGLSQETCRDIWHVSFGMVGAINAAETALQQGVDLYQEESARLTAALEFHAKYITGTAVPSWLCGGSLQLAEPPTWEIAYNHYHNRLGMSLPMTRKVIALVRPTRAALHMAWETLTHAELGALGLGVSAVAPDARQSRAPRARVVFTGAGMFRLVRLGEAYRPDGAALAR
jgi:hypothetical protein